MIFPKITHFVLFAALLYITGNSFAQESVNAGGGEALDPSGSFSFSMGQTVYTSLWSENGSLAQGIQQPFSLFEVSVMEPDNDIQLLAYPNPASHNITLQVDKAIPDLFFQLYDMKGQLLQYEKIKDEQTSISIYSFTPGIYVLRILQAHREIKTFKIIKH